MTPGTLAIVRSPGFVPVFNRLEPYGEADRYLLSDDIVLIVGTAMKDRAWPTMVLVVEFGRVGWAYAEDLSEDFSEE